VPGKVPAAAGCLHPSVAASLPIAAKPASFTPDPELLRELLMPVGDCRPLHRRLRQVTLECHEVVVLRVGVELLHALDLLAQASKEDINEPPILLSEVRVCAHTQLPSRQDHAHGDRSVAQPLAQRWRMLL
jgi:hypothetical protein